MEVEEWENEFCMVQFLQLGQLRFMLCVEQAFPEEVCECVADVTCAEGATPAITLGHMLTPLPPLTAACSYDPRGLDPCLGACNRGLWAGARVINVPKMGETFNYS